MKYNIYETIIGGAIIIFFIICSIAAYNASRSVTGKSYMVTAKFQSVEGLSVGSKVKVSGVKIGEVKGITLAPDLSVIVAMTLNQDVRLPNDSSAAVVSEGLMGPKFVAVRPGGEDNMLKNGDEIVYTESSLNIEEIVKKMIYHFAK